jgi:hypothetical protein
MRVGRAKLFLKIFGRHIRVRGRFAESGKQADCLNDFFFLQGNSLSVPYAGSAASPGSTGPSGSAASPTPSAANGGHCADGRASRVTISSAVGAFGSRNQLQEFLRIIQPLLELGSECLCGDLGCDRNFSGGWISSHEFHFIDLDRRAATVAKGVFDLLGDVLSFRPANRKGAYQPCEVLNRDLRREVNAGKAGSGQQLGEAALCLPGFERNPIEEELVAGYT